MSRQKLKIKDVCKFVGGSQPPKEVFIKEEKEGYIRLIQTRDYKTDSFKTYIPKELARRYCSQTDIMIGRYGPPIFQICRGLEGAYNVALLKAVPKKNILNEYLYYFLSQQSIFKYVDSLSKRTGGQTGVDLTSLNEYPIDLPSIHEQSQIAKVLSDLDTKIELNNKINRELEAMAKTLYDYWFVQFDFPNEEGKPYKSSGGKMEYNDELKREIPEEWDVKKLSSITSFLSRGISPSYLEEGGICVLNQKCVRDQKINFEFSRRHNHIKRDPGLKIIQNLDVLVNSTGVGTLGRVGIVKWLTEEIVTVDSHVTIVRSDPKKVNPYFSGFSILQKQSEIERFSIGSTGQVELSKSQLQGIKLILPPRFIQDSFGSIYSSLLKKASITEKQNQHLTALRDWLLPMLMNGQVKVTDEAEKEEGNINEASNYPSQLSLFDSK